MKRKRRWLLIFVIFAAFGIWLEPTRVVWGWLRGEAFFGGRPTNWWAEELVRWEIVQLGDLFKGKGSRIDPNLGLAERSKPNARTWVYNLRRKSGAKLIGELITPPDFDFQGPAIFRGDPAAQPVLLQLAEGSDDHLRELADYGLRQIESTSLRRTQ